MMGRTTIRNYRVIITGASSGIGASLARRLVDAGANVIITARRKDRLDRLVAEHPEKGNDGRLVAVPGDITDANHREELIATAKDEFGGLDSVVNNAGIGAVGPFRDAAEDRLRKIMEVNFFAPVELIRLSLPLLQQGTTPMIVNIGSVLGHRAVPKKSEYCASKFAMHGFSDSLRAELRRCGIHVLLVSPSTTSSEFFDQLIEHQGTAAKNPFGMTPEKVAAKIESAMRRRKHEVILSFGGKTLVWLDRLLPTVMNHILARFG